MSLQAFERSENMACSSRQLLSNSRLISESEMCVIIHFVFSFHRYSEDFRAFLNMIKDILN